MSDNQVQTVKDFFATMRSGDMQALLALCAEDIEWIIPGKGWPWAGTYHGHAGLKDFSEAFETTEISNSERGEFVAQGDRVLVPGFATVKFKPQTRRSSTIGFSLLPFEMAKYRRSGSISTRKRWRGPPMNLDNEEIIKKLYAAGEGSGMDTEKFGCAWRVQGPQGAAARLGLTAFTVTSRLKRMGLARGSDAHQAFLRATTDGWVERLVWSGYAVHMKHCFSIGTRL